MKSLRQKLIEHGKLQEFLQTHSVNPANKYFPTEPANMMADQPLQNYMDVSARAGGRAATKTWPGGERSSWGPPEGLFLDLRGIGSTGKQSEGPLLCSLTLCLCILTPPVCQAGCWALGKQQRTKTGPAPDLTELTSM